MTARTGEDEEAQGASASEATPASDPTPASDAFERLASEVRVAAIDRLHRADRPLTFTELFEASDADTSAGFAYHLRQLRDHYAETVALDDEDADREGVPDDAEEGYRLTPAGRRAAREIAAGGFRSRDDTPSTDLDADCPVCGDSRLSARAADGVATVGCDACGTDLLSLSVPPGEPSEEAFPDALDAYHRHRIGSFADGHCPDCGGSVAVSLDPVPAVVAHEVESDDGEPSDETTDDWAPDDGATDDEGHDDGPEDTDPRAASATLECEVCGATVSCPVTVAVLDASPVVAFYEDHDEDLGDRRLWNVGEEWRERVVSTDPWCVCVSSRLDDEVLEVYVDRDLTVRGTRRFAVRDVADDRIDAAEQGEGDESPTDATAV